MLQLDNGVCRAVRAEGRQVCVGRHLGEGLRTFAPALDHRFGRHMSGEALRPVRERSTPVVGLTPWRTSFPSLSEYPFVLITSNDGTTSVFFSGAGGSPGRSAAGSAEGAGDGAGVGAASAGPAISVTARARTVDLMVLSLPWAVARGAPGGGAPRAPNVELKGHPAEATAVADDVGDLPSDRGECLAVGTRTRIGGARGGQRRRKLRYFRLPRKRAAFRAWVAYGCRFVAGSSCTRTKSPPRLVAKGEGAHHV